MKRSRLKPGDKSLERGSTFAAVPQPLKRRAPLVDGSPATRRSGQRPPISPASDEQRAKVRHRACIACAHPGPCHPAHVIDRSLGGGDDPRSVVPLCPRCHRLYDTGHLDLLPHLEPGWRVELAFAVELVGLVRALQRVTNERWAPERSAA